MSACAVSVSHNPVQRPYKLPICIWGGIHAYTHTYIYTRVATHITYIDIYTYICGEMCIHTYTYIYILYIYIYTYAYIYVHIFIYIYIYVCVCVYI